jgi:hypothetical protein
LEEIKSSVCLDIDKILAGSVFHFLQNGFMARTTAGSSLGNFLRCDCGIADEYIDKRISTILLNGKPVDDIDSAIIHGDSTVALSGSMPGLMGAVMRRGSCIASLRASITHKESGECLSEPEEIMIRVKLFNVLTGELGPGFLKKGIYIDSGELKDFLEAQDEGFWNSCISVSLNGESVDPSLLAKHKALAERGLVLFSINTPYGSSGLWKSQ